MSVDIYLDGKGEILFNFLFIFQPYIMPKAYVLCGGPNLSSSLSQVGEFGPGSDVRRIHCRHEVSSVCSLQVFMFN